ncbi:MAG TPA: low molecular weight phosphotyrosine protein phosphatase [Chromatiales bacterium]|nr:low molecular weight phosphotyrosine protein phosphatase [Thiotrichales bacterium]HIP67511.1 low molecular weight phosphotyrosine protein phosphatase [Chromatiales bacterium]
MAVKVLFICMGNICRSPTAHGVFAHQVAEAGLNHVIEIDSAGTHAYHVGEPPDHRAQNTARQRGYDLSDLRARKVQSIDCEEYDYLIVMDQDNLVDVKALCTNGSHEKVQLFLRYAENTNTQEVPDPYYGGSRGFDHVLDLVEAASAGLLQEIRQKWAL